MNEVILPKKNIVLLHRDTFSKRMNQTITMLILTLGGMIIVLSIIFISMSSANSQKGYELKLIQTQYEELRTENEKLQTQLNESQSFSNLEETEKIKEMAEPDTKRFVTKKKPKN